MQISLYVPEPLPTHEIFSLLQFRYPFTSRDKGLFKEHMPSNYFQTEVQFVELEHAKAILLSNNFRSLDDATRAYIATYVDEAARRKIPLIVFSCGDFTDTLQFDPRVYVLRFSLYRDTRGLHDISIPTLTEDLGREGIVLRNKEEVPMVSFCGQAGYKTLTQWIKYYIKLAVSKKARRVGVYWRRAMLSACTGSSLVKTNFIIRRSFSGAHKTIELDPLVAREEFISSIVNADFVLAAKGDGNYSNRFLEALSLGRIPVLVDTEVVLPLENVIDYSHVVVRVPMSRVGNAAAYVRDFYDLLSESEWQERQQLARQIFKKYLRVDSYFKYFFENVLPTLTS